MSYETITINDPNPIKRWFQRRRFHDALRFWENSDEEVNVLDFGGGDGELLRLLAVNPAIRASIYEPVAPLMDQAKQKLSNRKWIAFHESTTGLQDETYDYIFCLEVLEHLPQNERTQALGDIHRLLKQSGFVIISVPLEIFFPALVKGIFRMYRRFGKKYDSQPKNIFAAMIGRPPLKRPTSEIAPGFNYHFDHLGFDFRYLQRQIAESFTIKRKWFSPFPFLGSIMNSEVYYLVQKTP